MHAIVANYALAREIRQGSIDQLEYALARFAKFLGRSPDSADFTDENLNRFLLWLAHEKYAIETMRSSRAALLALWKSEAEQGRVPPHRRIRRVPPSGLMPRAWTQEQMQAILAACGRLCGTFRTVPIQRRLFATAFCLAAYETGYRLGDVLRIRRLQIQPSGLIAMVQSKTGRVHLARIRPETIQAIDEMGTAGRETVFGGVVCNRRLSRLLGEVFRSAGITDGSLKWLRRSAATHVEMQQPGAGWKFLGHTTPRMAEQSYLDPLQIGKSPLIPPKID